MSQFTQLDVDRINMRQRAKKQPDSGVNVCDEFEGKEEELAQLCIAEIKRRRWYFTRNTPGRYSTSTAGTVDLIIAAPPSVYDPCEPRTFWCELKKKGGKLSEAQNITKHVLLGMEHKWACIYSFQQFIDFIGPS